MVSLPTCSSWRIYQQRPLPDALHLYEKLGISRTKMSACEVNELMLTMLFRQYPGFQEALQGSEAHRMVHRRGTRTFDCTWR